MIHYVEPPALIRSYAMNGIKQNQNQNNKMLHELVKDVKNLSKLRKILQQPGIDVDSIEYGSTALYKSASFGNADAVDLLLRYSANINHRNRYNGWNALMTAIFNKHIEIMKRLLAHPNLDINAQDDSQNTALHLAATQGCVDCVNLLLNHPDINVNIKNYFGNTPLINAAFGGHTEVVRSLLARHDIEVNFVDNDRDTALNEAVNRGHIEIVKLLLAMPQTNLDITDRPFRQTAYDTAVERGRLEIINLLREHRNSHSFGDVLSPNDNYKERPPEPRRRPTVQRFELIIPRRHYERIIPGRYPRN